MNDDEDMRDTVPLSIDDVDPITGTVEVYGLPNGQLMWRLIASNGEKLCRGSEGDGFSGLGSCWNNLVMSARLLGGILGALDDEDSPAPSDLMRLGELTVSRPGLVLTIKLIP